MKKNRLALAIAAAAFAATTAFGSVAFAAQEAPSSDGLNAAAITTQASATAELTKVQTRFPGATIVLEATDDNLDEMLSTAGDRASASMPVIVHATGAIKTGGTTVPENVILVGESSTTYTWDGGMSIFNLQGSIFGGNFKGGNCYYNILANGTVGGGVNGYIEDVSINGAQKYGIAATQKAKGVSITNCKITGVGDCGIQAISGSTIKLIKSCTITNVGESGIDIVHANVTTISNNTIKNSKAHGISTDTEHGSVCPQQKTCKIGTIQNNTITGSKLHGIYVEAKCTVNAIKNNKIYNNKTGINVMKNATAKGVAGNKIYSNKKSNVTASGKNATVILGASNKIYKAGEHGISVSAGGKVTISGAKNQIYSNKNGINVVGSGSFLKITGKNTQVKSNKNNGISFNNKAKGNIANVTFSKNKKVAVYIAKGCKCPYKKCNVSTKSSAKNRIYAA